MCLRPCVATTTSRYFTKHSTSSEIYTLSNYCTLLSTSGDSKTTPFGEFDEFAKFREIPSNDESPDVSTYLRKLTPRLRVRLMASEQRSNIKRRISKLIESMNEGIFALVDSSLISRCSVPRCSCHCRIIVPVLCGTSRRTWRKLW